MINSWHGTCRRCKSMGTLHPILHQETPILFNHSPYNYLCNDCIGEIEYHQMTRHNKMTLYIKYIGGIPLRVINWYDSPIMRHTIIRYKHGRHNMCGKRLDVWFAHAGNIWWGWSVGDNNIVRCICTLTTV